MTKKTQTARKAATKTVTKPAPAAQISAAAAAVVAPSPMAQMADTLTKAPALTPAQQKKADRDADRAKRFPAAAKEEAAKKAEGKTVRKAGEPKPAKTTVAKETVAFIARLLKKNAPVHVLSITARPTSGVRLAAHTHAALSVLGMLDASCPIVPVAAVRTLMGDRAIAYHSKENNFASAADHGIRLTPAGRNKFLSRSVDGKIANAFVDMFLDGKVDEATLSVKAGEVFQAKF